MQGNPSTKNQFVPLNPSLKPGTASSVSLRPKIISQSGSEPGIPSPAPLVKTAANCPSQALAHLPHGEPKLSLERAGDRITKIIVRCSCGQEIEFDCIY